MHTLDGVFVLITSSRMRAIYHTQRASENRYGILTFRARILARRYMTVIIVVYSNSRVQLSRLRSEIQGRRIAAELGRSDRCPWVTYGYLWATYVLPEADPAWLEFRRQRQEAEIWRDYQAQRPQQSASSAASSTISVPATTSVLQPTANNPVPTTSENVPAVPAPGTARALPMPQNQALIAPNSYGPFLGAQTLAPSSGTLSTTHANQARLQSSSRSSLPRRTSQRPAGRPAGSTTRLAPSLAMSGPNIESCVFINSDGVRMFRLTVQVYPPIAPKSKLPLFVYDALKFDWRNYLEAHGLLFEYDLPASTPVQELLHRAITDLSRGNYSFPPILRYGDTAGAPMPYLQLLAHKNKGKNTGGIKLASVMKPSHWTIEHLAADRNYFAAPDVCIEYEYNRPNRFLIRIIPTVFPLYRQVEGVKHECITSITYRRFPRDGGSLQSASSQVCFCAQDEHKDEDSECAEGDDQLVARMLLPSTSTTFSPPSPSFFATNPSVDISQPGPSSAVALASAFVPSTPLRPRSALPPRPRTPSPRPRLALRSLPTATSSLSVSSSAASAANSSGLPREIWSENTVFLPEPVGDVDRLDIESFMDSVYSAATVGGSTVALHINATDIDDAHRQYVAIIDDCLRQGDCERILVKPHQRIFSLQYPQSATGPGVERETLWSVFSGFDLPSLLMSREDNFSTLRPLFTSTDIPVPASRLDIVRRLGAVTALLLISGRWPFPLDPSIFQYLIHGGNLHALHPSFVGEWHPSLRQRLLSLIDLGPDADLTPFESDLATYLDSSATVYRRRDLATHLAIPPLLLHIAILGTASPPYWAAFKAGFDLPCPRNDFTFSKMIKRFQGGSEAFLSLCNTSFISDAEVFLNSVNFLTPTGTSQWTASLRTLAADPFLTCQGLFERFVRGSGIPCRNRFEEARGSFSSIIDLTRIDTPGFRGQIVAWAATGSPFIDLASDTIDIGPIATNDGAYAVEENQLYASAGTICFRTCTRSMRYPAEYLLQLASTTYTEGSEPSNFQEAFNFWILRECLLTIGRHSMA
ncbi:hypothetical protein R3P38DRAFT_2767227 [Favolaschia claudopus]|uniref:Uncharacterized protein n=1 Tax=Favolaschia claudopus TaxID=2862362 RepID=A0AAW0CY86_9AGAR